MRTILVLTIVAFLVLAPTAMAEGETDVDASAPAPEPATTADEGPDPTGCRPYCIDGE